MADKNPGKEAEEGSSKETYKGTKVVTQLTDKEPGLEPVPLFESFIAPTKTYKRIAEKLLSRGGTAKALTDKESKYAKGGSVSKASKRADGIATKGKTKGRMV